MLEVDSPWLVNLAATLKGTSSEHSTHTSHNAQCTTLQAMLEVDSPWLVNLAATLKDDRNIYMLLEAVLGGELFAYLQVRV